MSVVWLAMPLLALVFGFPPSTDFAWLAVSTELQGPVVLVSLVEAAEPELVLGDVPVVLPSLVILLCALLVVCVLLLDLVLVLTVAAVCVSVDLLLG